MFKNVGGLQSLLKDGHKHYSGLEEALLRNIEACKGIADMTRTSLGPNGMNKMVINHLEKLFVTSDAATIVREMEIQHPAAKMVALAAKRQEEDQGDATNLVIVFAGELMQQAENLIKMGLHPSDILTGYEKAHEKVGEFLQEIVCHSAGELTQEEVTKCLKPVVASKQYGVEDILTPLIAEACLNVLPRSGNSFNVENVRVAKLLGKSLNESEVVRGMVVLRRCESQVIHVKEAKIAVYSCPIELVQAETKGNVLLKNAEDLKNYSKGEEEALEAIIKEIADSGVNTIFTGSTITDLAMHFIDRYKLLAVKVPSKFELRRICKTIGATPLARMGAPTPEEMGEADEVSQEEIGSQQVTIIKRESDDNKVSTVVLRGSTNNLLDDAERAVDDAVNVMKALITDKQFVPGAGCAETILASKIQNYGATFTNMSQYSVKKFGEAFEVIPRTLGENCGTNTTLLLGQLYAQNSEKPTYGIDIDEGTVYDVVEQGILDHLKTKLSAISLATDAVVTVLRVDQMIMSKPAGGPKPQQQQPQF